ncbi:hypothetical protein BC939DRAFT_470927 [Gamsiella multidivaricata]|uniref:uncharacterized protein n=1 Tax=Gamsiella multidivaricata TaxID=101098 RepID=UPI00221EEA8F|nr:uncharacterized protein BC939DRAFT_470927 [Gamsiella multidivaricata]KAG0364742.1 hypothetical protein BGZ54_007199 [Gamsiella multidivaricata]KAI7815936.1 hypothetical protein BC939DRAFT_470927 [Gamsiella multidivaricata]
MLPFTPSTLYRRMDATRIAREVVKGIPAGLVISLNAWAVSAWLKATILINSQPRWLFRKKRWSEGEMRAISCYYLVVAYLMLRVVRLTSALTKRPGRPYGDFFRNTRPILGKIAIFSLATMLMDEFVMFYILRKFGLEKRRILITGRPLEKDEHGHVQMSDDDCCICYGAMLDSEDDEDLLNQADPYMNGRGLNRDTDHVLENFCTVRQHVAHRGCIRKWYNYGPKGYRPMEAFRIFNWGTTLHGAVAGIGRATPRAMGNRIGLGWLLALPDNRAETDRRLNVIARVGAARAAGAAHAHGPAEEQEDTRRTESVGGATTAIGTPTMTQQIDQQQDAGMEELRDTTAQAQQPESEDAADAAEPVLRPLFPQQDDLDTLSSQNAGRKTCPACRQQLILNFVDLAKGRKEMGYLKKLQDLGRDMTKFSDWRGLILRSLITAGWVGVTIVGGKLRIMAMDKAIAKHQKNRALATLSALTTEMS